MNLLKRSALTVSLLAILNLPGAVLAQEAPQLEAAPATAAAPAPMDDMQTMRERMQEMMQSKGMWPGNKCNKRDGQGPGMMMQGGGMGMMGMGGGKGAGMDSMGQGKNCDRKDGKGPGMGMGPGGMGRNCDRRGDGGCDVSQRLDDLEKRMDMMQMMMKMMMR
jgi:hypothetical protein